MAQFSVNPAWFERWAGKVWNVAGGPGTEPTEPAFEPHGRGQKN